jgi:hypothetical protein
MLVGALTAAPQAQAGTQAAAIGPVFGGGNLAGLNVTAPLSEDVSLGIDLGLRPGVSIRGFYANFAGVLVAAGELSRAGRTRHGLFAAFGASAPLSFFDAWTAGGWHMSSYDTRGLRQLSFELGPAYYLVRDLPPETDLRLPVFLYLRFVYHVPLVSPDAAHPAAPAAPPASGG